MLTKKPAGRKSGSSLFSSLLRRSIVPEETLKPQLLQDFLDASGHFERILEDSGFVKLRRLTNDELSGNGTHCGLVERYINLQPNENNFLLHDIQFEDGIQVGNNHCQLFTLADAADLPGYCGSRLNYDKYPPDRTQFRVGFASPLGQLLPCNDIYNQYIFVDDSAFAKLVLSHRRQDNY